MTSLTFLWTGLVYAPVDPDHRGVVCIVPVYHRIWDRTSGNDVIDYRIAVFVANLVDVLSNMLINRPRHLLP